MSVEQQDDVLELDDVVIDDEDLQSDQVEQQETETSEDAEAETIGFADEEGDAEPTDLVKHLRRENRELHKRIAAQRREPENVAPVVVGDRPSLEACDYDEERFADELDGWHDRKRQAEDQRREQERTQSEQQQRWQTVTDNYNKAKAALPFADKDDMEEATFAALPDTARAILAKVSDDPARLVYALGKSPAKLAELAKISDPLELTKAIVKMEAKVTTKQGKRPPAPDAPVKGGVVTASRGDKEEERLEKEADRTGDRSALIKYRRDKREK